MRYLILIITLLLADVAYTAPIVNAQLPAACSYVPENKISFTTEEADKIPASALLKLIRMRKVYTDYISEVCKPRQELDL